MSYTKAYVVSTCHKNIETSAIVQSGNSRAAIKKFLFHMYPELIHYDMEKLPSSHIDGRKISQYRIEYPDGKFSISAEKVNITSDFILVHKSIRCNIG